MRRWTRKVLRLLLLAIGIFVVGMLICELAVEVAASGRCYSRLEDVPHRRAGLVLGTSKYVRAGQENLHYRFRIEAAAKLYHAGKVDCLIVSGNGVDAHYNEPRMMRRDLVALGVPEERIIDDEFGLRTLDSVIRAREQFGEDDFIVISQPWHNKRAVFIARAHGMDAIGWNATEVAFTTDLRTAIRERFARVLAVLDVTVLNKRPQNSPVITAAHVHNAPAPRP